MKRKTFIQRSLGGLLLTLPVYSLSSCSSPDTNEGNPDPSPDPQGNCLDNGTHSTIAANHGHFLSVPKADVMLGTEKSYSIKGTSPHNHNVTLTANDFGSLQSNHSITITSTSGDGHTHRVTVSCA